MSSPATIKKIRTAVDGLVPKKQAFTIYSSPTGFDGTEVVRVITPAWKTLGKAERIAKVENAVMPSLSPEEKKKIFRFSVLTPEEWENARLYFPEKKSKTIGFRRRTLGE